MSTARRLRGRTRSRSRSPALAAEHELWGAHTPRQARSLDTTIRLAQSGAAAFAANDYEEVSVAEIAAHAGVSVGTFYARFPSKDHLLIHLLGQLADELVAEMDRVLGAEVVRVSSLAQVVRRYLALSADSFVRHRGVVRPASLIARQTRNTELRSLLGRFNHEVHGRFRTILAEKLALSGGRATTERIDIVILSASAALREVLLYGEPVSTLAKRHAALIDELTRTAVLSLTSVTDA